MRDQPDIQAILRDSNLFAGLGKESLERIVALVRPLKLDSGKVLFRKGDPVNGCYAILSGALKVSITDDGDEETMLAVIGAGDVTGEMGLVDRLPRSATVTALKESTLGHLPLAEFERLANKDTEIYRHLLCVLSERLRETNRTLVDRQHPLLSGRLARVLIRLSEGFGETLPDGRILIRQKLTQSQLGVMTGSARENISRQLSEWRQEQLLSRISGYYCIEDISVFQKLARR